MSMGGVIRMTAVGATAVGMGAVTGLAVALGSAALPVALLVLVALWLQRASFRPTFWLWVIPIAACFGAAVPRGSIVPLLTPFDLALLGAAAHVAAHAVSSGKQTRLPRGLAVSLAVFAGLTVFVPLFVFSVRGIDLRTEDLMAFLAPIRFILVLWIYTTVPASLRQRTMVVRTMLIGAGLVGALGLLQAAGVPLVETWIASTYPSGHTEASSQLGRVTSVMGAWNALGNFLMVGILMVLATNVEEVHRRARALYIFIAIVMVACLVATNLYSGLIGAVVGTFAIKTVDKRGAWLVWALLLGAATAGLLLAPDVAQRWSAQFRGESLIPHTIEYRIMLWDRFFWPDIVDEPFLGVSPAYDHLPFPFPESQYVHYLYRSGLFSLLGHLLWLGLTCAWLFRRVVGRARLPFGFDRSVALAAMVSLGTLSMVGFINPVFTYATTMTYVWAMVGLASNSFIERST